MYFCTINVGGFWVDWKILHNYCCYAHECFRNYLDGGQYFLLVEEERNDLR